MGRWFCFGKKDFCDCIEGCRFCEFADGTGSVSEDEIGLILSKIFGEDYDLDRLKELVEKDRNSAFAPYSKFPEKGQEVWYWDSENGISRGIVDFVNVDFIDNSLSEFGVDFPDENDFDIFAGSAWGTCIVASKESALEKMKERDKQ